MLDTNLNLPLTCQVAETAREFPCIIVTLAETIANYPNKVEIIKQAGIKLIAASKADNGKICIDDAMLKIAAYGINNVLIEAGTAINSALLKLNLVDRIAWFQAPIIIGNTGLPAFSDMYLENLNNTTRFKLSFSKNFGNDALKIFDLS